MGALTELNEAEVFTAAVARRFRSRGMRFQYEDLPATLVALLFVTILAVVLSVMLPTFHAKDAQSARTQAAPTVPATVTSIAAGSYLLRVPHQPQQVTVAVKGDAQPDLIGRTVSLKVDPKDPGYGEFPGKPARDPDDYDGWVIGVVMFWIAWVGVVYVGFRQWRSRRWTR